MRRKIISIPPNYFYLAIFLIVLSRFVLPFANLIVFPYNLFGLFGVFFGFYLIFCSWFLFKKNNTPESFEPSTCMVAESIYLKSRNPMYLGAIVALIGFSALSGNLISFIFPVVFFLLINFMFIPFEEEKMYKTFGDDFLEYKKQVRRWV